MPLNNLKGFQEYSNFSSYFKKCFMKGIICMNVHIRVLAIQYWCNFHSNWSLRVVLAIHYIWWCWFPKWPCTPDGYFVEHRTTLEVWQSGRRVSMQRFSWAAGIGLRGPIFPPGLVGLGLFGKPKSTVVQLAGLFGEIRLEVCLSPSCSTHNKLFPDK